MRKLILLAILLLGAATAHAQATYDCFGGLLTYSDGSAAPTISGHPDVQNATISQSGTTQTAVVADATKYAVNEPMFVKGTSTAMDYSCDPTNPSDPNRSRSDAGASLITVVNTGTNTLTMTAPASRTQSGVSGTVTPAHDWVPGAPVSLGGKLRIPFVTPLDHWRFQEEIGAACAGSNALCPGLTVLTAKYGGSNCTMASSVYSQLKVLNFNGVTNNSDGQYDPTGNGSCSGNAKEPYSQEQFVSSYASVDLGGYATQPLINTTYGLTVTLTGPKRALLDYFNPQFQSFMTSFLPNFNNSFTSFVKSPWFGKVTVDDTGNVALTNATWNFHTNGNASANDNNPAYQILVSAPLQAGNNTNNPIYGGGPARPYLYKDPTVYSKTPCTYNPYGTSTTCGVPNCFNAATICRLADFLCCNGTSLYASLAAFNAAWGTAYTTMGSSETPHLAETVATGNGATTVFTGTLANSNVTPTSVQLYLTPSGGSPVFFGFGCWNSLTNCGGSAGQSVWKAAGSFVGQVAYPLHYTLTDSNGDIEEVTTAGTTASSAPTWPSAGSCIGTQTTVSGTATFTCRGSSVSAGNVTDSTGVFTLTTNNALANGATISVNYTTGGFKASGHTGFADEDGSNTAIFGTNSVCTKILPDWTASTNYGYAFGQTYEIHNVASGTWQIVLQGGTSGGSPPAFSSVAGTDLTDGTVIWESIGKPVCGTESGSTFGIANMNQTVAADLDAWLIQFASQYLKSVRTAVKTIAPHLLYQGPDQCGVWFNPCRREVALAMSTYSDVYYTTLADPSFDPNGTAKYKFITADYNGPVYLYTTYSTTQNAITTANCKDNYPCYASQAARGTGWYNLLNWSINQTPGLSGTYQLAGLLHWGTHNFQTSPFGLRSDLDNQYDGLEDTVAPLACSAPLSLLTCGGESALANFLGANGLTSSHSYKDANALWTLAPQNVTVPAVQISLNFLPPPAQLPAPVLTGIVPQNTYVTSLGFSQDMKSFAKSLNVKLVGANLFPATQCYFDGTNLPCSCTAVACTLGLTWAVGMVPSSSTAHLFSVANPAVVAPAVN